MYFIPRNEIVGNISVKLAWIIVVNWLYSTVAVYIVCVHWPLVMGGVAIQFSSLFFILLFC